MKTVVIYYTFGGTSKKEAVRIAEEKNATLYEVKEIKKRNIFTAFIPGCPHAMKRKASKIQPITIELDEFDQIILVAPVWGGFPVPAFNSMLDAVPAGKKIQIFLCSSGGETPKSEEGTCQLVKEKGCRLVEYQNIKTEEKKK